MDRKKKGLTCSRLVDPDLVHLLEEELQFEDSDGKAEAPAFVKEFLEAKLFQVRSTDVFVYCESNML